MPTIGIADKTTLDAINTKVGETSDLRTVASIFGKLVELGYYNQSYTSETVHGKLGQNTSSADTNTVFGYLKVIVDYVNDLESRITAARAAKLDDILDWAGLTPTYTELSTSSGSLVTVVNVSGKGLASVGVISSDTTAQIAGAKLTVDGVVISNVAAVAGFAQANPLGPRMFGMGGSSTIAPISGWGVTRWSTGADVIIALPWIGFKSSLLFEVVADGANAIIGKAVVLA